ncbi:indole-3-glycerol phosphate synthase [Cenarchaeum symbiosum A]|uniref:indole-3-glycerol-phosphate synthase n=1 Tax=Cenarchaeum symbiosum (strain A) TaxID=414004 RepID=A0RX33_CENSY|nr:indole-3-glycerol phosphate synthase [Cenarchaeum symbiosum A]
MLETLVKNSRTSVDAGVYEIRGAARGGRSIKWKEGRAALITEVKLASPSAGWIREGADPEEIAASMVRGGADALSVLTQPLLFHGSPEYFARVRRSVDVPMIMKDIIVDEAQVAAAEALGADYMLLIQSVFDGGYAHNMDEFIEMGHNRGVRTLLEVHTAAEFERAQNTEADLIGINNRNLDTLEIDLGTTEEILAGRNTRSRVISESGIKSAADIARLKKAGAAGFLVGSGIMGGRDIEGTVREMISAC